MLFTECSLVLACNDLKMSTCWIPANISYICFIYTCTYIICNQFYIVDVCRCTSFDRHEWHTFLHWPRLVRHLNIKKHHRRRVRVNALGWRWYLSLASLGKAATGVVVAAIVTLSMSDHMVRIIVIGLHCNWGGHGCHHRWAKSPSYCWYQTVWSTWSSSLG